jgi:predicted GH43/DUF377 family glycosyl hydrolase
MHQENGMAWVKKGLVYGPSGEADWMRSHAQIPTALARGDTIRLYITVRPEQKISMTTFVDVDMKDPSRVLYVHKKPILPLGGQGTFDEFGVMPSAALEVNGDIWLYTIGWTRGHTVPYLNAIGLAISKDGGTTFERPFIGPVLDRTPYEPYSTMSPSILRQGDQWHMWYGSGVDWITVNGKCEPIYVIKYAHSSDGLLWHRPNICCVPGQTPGEASTRPAVIYDNGLFHMWFSYRGSQDFRGGKGSYRMGYASSKDGKSWRRGDDDAGIAPGDAGAWDSDMMAYPNIIDTPYGRYMFYNGNRFGAEGFGYAVWQA